MIKFEILSQPDDISCGPTCLHAVYKYLGYSIPLKKVIRDVMNLENGGTLAVFLGIDALKRGFEVKLISYNLMVFDPSWKELSNDKIIDKLKLRFEAKNDKILRTAIRAYITYLEMGGRISFELLNTSLLNRYFKLNLPVLTGVSSTYLYDTKREYTVDDKTYYDDVRGDSAGHFIVLHGKTSDGRIRVADPYTDDFQKNKYYSVKSQRLINSILLGLVTYDANLLIINGAANK